MSLSVQPDDRLAAGDGTSPRGGGRAGAEALRRALFAHIADAAFPCVGAKAALGRDAIETVAARDFESGRDDRRIHDRLVAFAAEYRAAPTLFRSFVVMFEGPDTLDEAAFERALWRRLQALSDHDVRRGYAYDARVSSDPDDPHFSISLGGEAFFIVGLHPHAGRPARRIACPTMVFNLRRQFERLRAEGKYEAMRAAILARDEAVAGSRNPMIARHGEESEARQYSGRIVGEGWRCPFRYKGGS